MTLAELIATLPATDSDAIAFPRRMLGAFRRKSIIFCDGTCDERTVVYWFQSRSFTIDLRLLDGAATPATLRQGWVGDTLWDAAAGQCSWAIFRSYQPHNQWPEPARLSFIGNAILEFAPSGAYVEDWRQQSTAGTLLGLRLLGMRDEDGGQTMAMAGGLVMAGEHIAYAQSRLPALDDALRGAASLEQALADGIVTEREMESYEVSVAIDGDAVTHSTRPDRIGQIIGPTDFRGEADGTISASAIVGDRARRLLFSLDVHLPHVVFDSRTECTAAAREWMAREKEHLSRHAVIVR